MDEQHGITRRGALAETAVTLGAGLGFAALPIAQNRPLKICILGKRARTAAYIGENGLRAPEWTARCNAKC